MTIYEGEENKYTDIAIAVISVNESGSHSRNYSISEKLYELWKILDRAVAKGADLAGISHTSPSGAASMQIIKANSLGKSAFKPVTIDGVDYIPVASIGAIVSNAARIERYHSLTIAGEDNNEGS